MAQAAKPSILFHLIPLNDISRETLVHPDNRRFVSPVAADEGLLGLEVGFHVSSVPGRVIARLGRDSDLILGRRNISSVHVAFEIHPDTLVLLLSVRAKCASSVVVIPVGVDGKPIARETVEGDCVLRYGQKYKIYIAGYIFRLVWRQTEPGSLRALAIRDYEEALRQQANVRSRKLPTESDSELHTWHNTRVQSARRNLFREADRKLRVKIGDGTFGAVYRTVDLESGNAFAVKVIKLDAYTDIEYARAAVHREVKNLQRADHVGYIPIFPPHDPGVPITC